MPDSIALGSGDAIECRLLAFNGSPVGFQLDGKSPALSEREINFLTLYPGKRQRWDAYISWNPRYRTRSGDDFREPTFVV